jgi:ABC-2 type transport system permease protein
MLSQMIEAIIKANVDNFLPGIIPFFPFESIWKMISFPFPRYAFQEIKDYVSFFDVAIVITWTLIFNYLSYWKLKRSDI